MIYSATEPFCDWLDVTYSPVSDLIGSEFKSGILPNWLLHTGAIVLSSCLEKTVFRVGLHGTVVMQSNKRFNRVSASGASLAHFRALGVYMDFLSELSSEPHRVTRLDAAIDVSRDGADVFAECESMFTESTARLGRKDLPVKWEKRIREDGRPTGTCYLGHKTRARHTARVYDKADEALCRRGEHIPPTARYEVTARGERDRPSPTLRDAAEPLSLFWHIASPTLLRAPVGVPDWVPGDGESWTFKRPVLLPAEIVEKRIGFNPDLDKIAEIASKDGQGGLKRMLRLIAAKYHIDL